MPTPLDQHELREMREWEGATDVGNAERDFGLGVALLVIAAVAAGGLASMPTSTAVQTAGTIEAMYLLSRECPCATVRVDDRLVRLRDQTLRQCQVGDRIPLYRWDAPFGPRYRFITGSCRPHA